VSVISSDGAYSYEDVLVLVVAELVMPGRRPPVCRCLFGQPDPGDVDKFLQESEEALERLTDEASRRWEFDFRAGCPLEDTPEADRRFEWTRVNSHDPVPPAYNRLYQSTSVLSTAASEVSADVGEPSADVVTSTTADQNVTDAVSETSSSAATESTTAEHNSPTGPDCTSSG